MILFEGGVDGRVERRAGDFLVAVGDLNHGKRVRVFGQTVHGVDDFVEACVLFVTLPFEKFQHSQRDGLSPFGHPNLERKTSRVEVVVEYPQANGVAAPQLAAHAGQQHVLHGNLHGLVTPTHGKRRVRDDEPAIGGEHLRAG